MGKVILGISAFYHDSAAALLNNGYIVAAAHEERFTRKKHDPSFPKHAIEFCLKYGGFDISEVDIVIFYDKPLLKFERLLETYYNFAPKGVRSFISAIPVWLKEKLFLRKLLTDELSKIGKLQKERPLLLFSEHHLSHGASAFYPSPFSEAAVLTVDGVGEWATASISYGKGNNVTMLREMKFPHSLGLLYSAFTYFLGFKVNSGEYKLMGLAPYGNRQSSQVARFKDIILKTLIDVKEDGSVFLNQDYFQYATGLSMVNDTQWAKLFGFKRRGAEEELVQCHGDLALAIQEVTEDIVIKMAQTAKKLTGSKNLCMAGGVALNCVANSKLLLEKVFENIWIQPAAGDAGGALGAAYAAHFMYDGQNRTVDFSVMDLMQGAYLGPEFSDLDIKLTARKYKAPYTFYEDFDALCQQTASALADGKVAGWFQGRMEWGPRALGNRSIVADPRDREMQKRLNLKIKYREGFRPFAPSVLYEDVSQYFSIETPSPYMMFVADVVKERQIPLPVGYENLSVRDKLYFIRSDIPGVTHLDYSARLQTVHKETNPQYYSLIHKFKEKTGYSLVVNTSFNVRGEPIVCTPEDAYRCFMRTDMDCLVMGNFMFDKSAQPPLPEKGNWKNEFVLD
ncbi:MAG: carbamoyltransferase [Nitrospirae bacterium]|nr:carbamoyltransferase [Nitrospirota bacterium]MBF0535490.1 carbamoyltransferase [Nitrospirota bacterium]MBF0617378.1 carbamoyltransferase [Nitrospirota bacterium]